MTYVEATFTYEMTPVGPIAVGLTYPVKGR